MLTDLRVPAWICFAAVRVQLRELPNLSSKIDPNALTIGEPPRDSTRERVEALPLKIHVRLGFFNQHMRELIRPLGGIARVVMIAIDHNTHRPVVGKRIDLRPIGERNRPCQ